MKKIIKRKEGGFMKGQYRIVKTSSAERIAVISRERGIPQFLVKLLDLVPTREEFAMLTKTWESPVVRNKIVSSDGYGRNLVMRQFANDTTYPLPITLAKIGTGSTAPADGDTDLETPVLSSISYTDRVVTNDSIELTFFITDGSLTDGTYTEWGLFCATRLFSRSLILPTYAKASGQDTTIIHVITLS